MIGDVIYTRGKAGITETNLSARLPAGVILDYGGTSAPTGFLNCDGSNVSRTTYAGLFTAIGTSFGVGDNSTTFGLPNFRRKIAVGSGGTGTATLSNTVGSSGGAETHQLTTAELANHSHFIEVGSGAAGYYYQSGSTWPYKNDGSSSGYTGSNSAHNNMQPSLVVYKIIKT